MDGSWLGKPQILRRAQVWVYSFGQMKLEPLSGFRTLCHHPAGCQNHCTCNIMLSFLKCDRSPFPSIPGLLLKYHPEESGMTFWESTVFLQLFLLCLSGEGVTCLVAWPQLPLLILFGSIALENATVVCGFAHICPLFIVSTEVLLPTLSFLIQCPLCPSLLLRQGKVMQTSCPYLTLWHPF